MVLCVLGCSRETEQRERGRERERRMEKEGGSKKGHRDRERQTSDKESAHMIMGTGKSNPRSAGDVGDVGNQEKTGVPLWGQSEGESNSFLLNLCSSRAFNILGESHPL